MIAKYYFSLGKNLFFRKTASENFNGLYHEVESGKNCNIHKNLLKSVYHVILEYSLRSIMTFQKYTNLIQISNILSFSHFSTRYTYLYT